MPAATKNLTFEQHADFKLRLVWLDKNRKPVNLTGYAAKLQVRAFAGSPVLLDANTTNGFITLGTVNGVIEIGIPMATISALTFNTAQHDLVLTHATIGVFRFIKGKVTFSPGITAPA